MLPNTQTRPLIPGDVNFIFSTWLPGLYYGNEFFGEVPADIFFPAYRAAIQRLLDTPGTAGVAVVMAEDPDVILGYAIFGQDALHWVFVKKAWRKLGVARELFLAAGSPQSVTHITSLGKTICRKHNLTFNPFKL